MMSVFEVPPYRFMDNTIGNNYRYSNTFDNSNPRNLCSLAHTTRYNPPLYQPTYPLPENLNFEFTDSYFAHNNRQESSMWQATPQQSEKSTIVTNRTPADNSDACFRPKLITKPNAQLSLEQVNQRYEKLIENDSSIRALPNPYEYEIDTFPYLPTQLKLRSITAPVQSLNNSFFLIDTVPQLHAVCNELNKQQEFAVKIAQHTRYSYQGYSCFLIISTRQTDYLIDAIALENHLQILNHPFTNSSIVKVVHKSSTEILRLQRDFGVYIVNLFDCEVAGRQLHFKNSSLNHLMESYYHTKDLLLGNNFDELFDSIDWRARPLNQEMIFAARLSTHYLLYIYDNLSNLLIRSSTAYNNCLLVTLNSGRKLSKQVFHKNSFQPSLNSIYSENKVQFSSLQNRILKTLFTWRDKISRKEDVSTQYFLPNHLLLKIVETAPTDRNQLLSCISSEDSLPLLFQRYTSDIIQMLSNVLNSQLNTNDSSLPIDSIFQLAKWTENQDNTASNNNSNDEFDEDVRDLDFSRRDYKIPDSLEEIYHLSNFNRTRNKDKKKLKDETCKTGEDECYSTGSDGSGAVLFMKKIGWLEECCDEEEISNPQPLANVNNVASTTNTVINTNVAVIPVPVANPNVKPSAKPMNGNRTSPPRKRGEVRRNENGRNLNRGTSAAKN